MYNKSHSERLNYVRFPIHMKKHRLKASASNCGPAGTRTLDPLIKSQLLYQLSYKTFLSNLKITQVGKSSATHHICKL